MEWNYKGTNKRMEFPTIFPQFPLSNLFGSSGSRYQNLPKMNLSGHVMNLIESLQHQGPQNGILVMTSIESCLPNFSPCPLPTKPKLSYADVAKIIPEVLRPKPEQKIPHPSPKRKVQEHQRPRHSYHKPLKPQNRPRPPQKPIKSCDNNSSKKETSRPSSSFERLVPNCSTEAGNSTGKKTLPRKCSSSPSELSDSVVVIPLPLKVRTLSDCSLDSDDSFIVFESNDEEESPVVEYITDDESSSEDEVDFCVAFKAEPYPLPSPCVEANKKWNLLYGSDNESTPRKNAAKKVSFAQEKDLAKVQTIVVWDFASRSARKGPWEQMARDSARFRERIIRTENILGPIMEPGHRQKIFSERFISDSPDNS